LDEQEILNEQQAQERKNTRLQEMGLLERTAETETNPFETERYRAIGYLSEVDGVPPRVKNEYWSPMSRMHALTNTEQKDVIVKNIGVRKIMLLGDMGKPKRRITIQRWIDQEQMMLSAISNFESSIDGFKFRGLVQSQKTFEHTYNEPNDAKNRPSGIRGIPLFGKFLGGGKR
jgi:hypothetical protein